MARAVTRNSATPTRDVCDPPFWPSVGLANLVAENYRQPPKSVIKSLFWRGLRPVTALPKIDFGQVISREVEAYCEAVADRERGRQGSKLLLADEAGFTAEFDSELAMGLELIPAQSGQVLKHLKEEFLKFVESSPRHERVRPWGRLAAEQRCVHLYPTSAATLANEARTVVETQPSHAVPAHAAASDPDEQEHTVAVMR